MLEKTDLLKGRGIFQDQKKVVEVELTRQDFVPAYLRTDQFMLRQFIAAHRYLKKEKILACYFGKKE